MKALAISSVIWAAVPTLAIVACCYYFKATYVPIDDNDSDLRGAGAIIYMSPYIFLFLAALLFVVGCLARFIRSRRQET